MMNFLKIIWYDKQNKIIEMIGEEIDIMFSRIIVWNTDTVKYIQMQSFYDISVSSIIDTICAGFSSWMDICFLLIAISGKRGSTPSSEWVIKIPFFCILFSFV